MNRRVKQFSKSYSTLEYKFSGMRIQETFFIPVDWQLEINLITPDIKVKSKSLDDIEYKISTIFQKLYFWLDTNMNNIIFVDVSSEDDLYIANLSSNIMMYCPGSTSDDMIARLLHSKLTALAGNDLVIGQIKIKSSDSVLQFTFDCTDGEYFLPATTEEYYTEGKAKDMLPWWKRNDGFCFEFIRPETTELSDQELFKDIVDPLDEFEKLLQESEEQESNLGIIKEPARIVQIEKWKPKKVD